MSSKLVSSLDMLNSRNGLQLGENGHYELTWSKMIKERILQFYFQLVRTNNKQELEQLDTIYTNLILDVITSNITDEERSEYITILYKMIAYTRDIECGKGEYQLSYMMIACWAKLQFVLKYKPEYKNNFNNDISTNTSSDSDLKNISFLFSQTFYINTNLLAYNALKEFVCDVEETISPIGSYKDIKYFIQYWRSLWEHIYPEHKYMDAGVIINIIRLVNNQLNKDVFNILSERKIDQDTNQDTTNVSNVSLVSKWIPREKSNKFGWMTKYFAKDYFSKQSWFKSSNTQHQNSLAEKKALTLYRKILSSVNQYIDTTQIKQCSGNWKEIDFDKHVTSITMSKQKYAFLNIKKNNKKKHKDNQDRDLCAEHYKQYITQCKEGTLNIKGTRVSIYDFVKDALTVIHSKRFYDSYGDSDRDDNKDHVIDMNLRDTINLQWKDNSTLNHSFNRLIAMVDTSGSMSCDNNTPLYNAIGLGIRIAERSTLGKRVLTFNSEPDWINLDTCKDFVSCVETISNSDWGMNTNFYYALDKILMAYIEMDLPPEKVENYGLVILSDMQIDTCMYYVNYSKTSMNTMFEAIEERFKRIGLASKYKTPYKVPFIVFWNLRKTNGFPATSITKNVAMVSGYSPSLLNQFLHKGIEAFNDYNPWDMMSMNIDHPRYEMYKLFIQEFIQNVT